MAMEAKEFDRSPDCDDDEGRQDLGGIGREDDIASMPISVPRNLGMKAFTPEEFSKYAWYQIDEASLILLEDVEPSLRRKYLKLGLLPGPRRYELGRFRLHERHLTVFEAIPALNEVAYTEVLESSADSPDEAEADQRNSSPAMRFLELTGKSDPIPEILLDLDEASDDEKVVSLLRGRDIVDSLDPVVGPLADFELEAPSDAQAAAVWTCFTGGNHAFENAYCPSGSLTFCHNGAHRETLSRSSGSSKRRNSFSRVASCFGGVDVRHYYRGWWWGSWKWFLAGEPFQPAQHFVVHGQVKSKLHPGGKKRRRKVEIFRTDSFSSPPAPPGGGYFRAFIRFYN